MIPEKWKTKEASPSVDLYTARIVSRPLPREEEPKLNSLT
jgi:hypothetical protein